VTDDDYEEDTMKNKKFIALLAMTVALSGVMTACSFGGGKEDSVVVESTPTPTPAKKAKVTPTVAADAQNTTYTSKDKSVAIKLPDATWANKSDETDMVSFESPDQGRILILHGSGADLESAVIPNSQDMAVSMTQAENMVNGTDFEIQDYKADQKDGINIYSYTVKYKDTTKSDGYVYAINKYFVNDSEYYSLVASVKKEDALKKVQESVDSFAILGDSTLKSAANGSAEERSVLLSLFHAALQKEASACQKQEHTAKELSECLRQFTGLCRQKKDETYASWLRQKEQGFALCKKQGLLKKDEEETNERVLKKLKKLEETAKKCRKTDPDQMKELFETVCELEQEKVEKEVKDVKLQIRRAAEFLQNSFPGGAEVVLFEANLARSPALRGFLIEKSMDAE